MGVLEHPDITGAFSEVVNRGIVHGKTLAAEELDRAKLLAKPLAEIPVYKADSAAVLNEAMEKLKNLELSHISQLERDQDQPISVIMAGLTLPRHLRDKAEEQADYHLKPSVAQLQVPIFHQPRDILDPFRIERVVSLDKCLTLHATRCAVKKGQKGKAILCGIGAAHQPRSDGVPVSVATVSLADALWLRRMEESKEEALAESSGQITRAWSI